MYMYTYIDLSLFFSSELHGQWAWSVMNALTYLPELWGGEAGTPLVEAWGVLYGLVGLVPLRGIGDPIPLVNYGLWKNEWGLYNTLSKKNPQFWWSFSVKIWSVLHVKQFVSYLLICMDVNSTLSKCKIMRSRIYIYC